MPSLRLLRLPYLHQSTSPYLPVMPWIRTIFKTVRMKEVTQSFLPLLPIWPGVVSVYTQRLSWTAFTTFSNHPYLGSFWKNEDLQMPSSAIVLPNLHWEEIVWESTPKGSFFQGALPTRGRLRPFKTCYNLIMLNDRTLVSSEEITLRPWDKW